MIYLRPARKDDFLGYYTCFDAVARESLALSRHQAPPMPESQAFFDRMMQSGNPFVLMFHENLVVGWCDVCASKERATHGKLGMGILSGLCGLGWGGKLLEATLEEARKQNFAIVALSVFSWNERARKLYARCGFLSVCRVEDTVLMELSL